MCESKGKFGLRGTAKVVVSVNCHNFKGPRARRSRWQQLLTRDEPLTSAKTFT